MRKRFVIAFLLAIPLQVSSLAQNQPQPGKARIPTATRQVVQFTQLETELLTAIQKKDEGALGRLLSDDYEVWTPAPPGDPIPREEWIQNAVKEPVRSFKLGQMAVRTFGDAAVVSFVCRQQVVLQGKEQRRDLFLVDVWIKSAEQWQLAVRYASRVEGLPRPSSPKPTGKE